MRTQGARNERSSGRLLLVSIAAIGILAGCNSGPSPEELAKQKAEAENTRLVAELQARDSLIGEMTMSFDDIEKNLALMEEQEKLVTSEASGNELAMDKRKRIVRNVQLMNGLMQESRDKIAELNARLDKSKIEASGLRKKLKELDAMLASRDSSITSMKDQLLAKDFRITQVNDQLTAIELEIAKREAIILQQETEINKAYVVMGTYKELEQKGVLTKEGGLVGIGKHVTLRDDARAAQFREVDLRELHKVPLEVKADKAVLVTEHPKGSYRIVEENDGLAYLEINDPAEFWRLSKYMVVERK
ncbi:MAG TPA: hypothetical protein VKG92_09215 [Flavobacteriales bacterium]|nr:hypothetical protein [Flavobacteriales bacterium]